MPSLRSHTDSSAAHAGADALYPVVLLVGGRRCLVAGGGRIATRKVDQLLAAGARVIVVSPVAAPRILDWARAGRIEYRPRPFAAADVRGCFAAFAATDDAAANRRLLAAGRRAGVVSTTADAHWREGDFITPAVAADAGLMIAVSTGGRSCRRARDVRRLLQNRLDLLGSCDLILASARWRSGTVRSETDPASQTAARLRQVLSVHEFVVSATPDGIDLLAVVRADAETATLISRLLPVGLRKPAVYRGPAAMRELVARWAADGVALARATARAQRRGWAGERMRAWIDITRRMAHRRRVGRPLELTDEGFRKDYERLVATIENRDTGQ